MAAKPSSSRAPSRLRRTPAKKPTRKAGAVAGAAAPANSKTTKPTDKSVQGKGAGKKRKASATSSRIEGQVEQIQRVIDVMVAAGAVEVELEEAGSKLRVRLKEDRPVMTVAAEPLAVAPISLEPRTAAPAREVAAVAAGEAPAAAGEVFHSPMVGTFYRASSPDTEPFVKEGDTVTEDTVLCIIEAMKVMNEIKAEMEGQIVEINAQNGDPVEYGQPLFTIKT